MPDVFELQKHVKYIVRSWKCFNEFYVGLDTNRHTLLYFVISSADILNEIHSIFKEKQIEEIIEWIYSLQVTSTSNCNLKGFRGSHVLSTKDGQPPPENADGAQLAQTYSALCSLLILGNDLSRIDRKGILETVKNSQSEDGSFWSQGNGSERDMRYVFCAVAICHILGDTEIIDWNKLKNYIRRALRFDGGFGQGDEAESHGGSTYCAIASLALGNRLWDNSVLSEKEIRKLTKWALWKQSEGFHGRAHKEDDSCYAFWIGATLKMLNAHEFIDQEKLRGFLYKVQHPHMGGFCKTLDTAHSDFLHTYFSIAALSLLKEPNLLPINPSLNVTQKAYERLMRIHHNFSR